MCYYYYIYARIYRGTTTLTHAYSHIYTYSHWFITNTIIGIYTYTCTPEGGLGGCRVAREME